MHRASQQPAELEHASFRIPDEITVRVVWRADFERQRVVMESRNLERLGFAACALLPESIGPWRCSTNSAGCAGRPEHLPVVL